MVFFDRGRLDAGEADLATVLQAKAARIDHGGDAALTLRLERASGCVSRTGRGGNEQQAARQRYRDKSAAPRFRPARRFHDEPLRPVEFLYVDHLPTRSVSDIVSLTKGKSMEVNGIAHIFLTASNFERSREFYRKLLPFLGLKPVIDTDAVYYCVGGRTAVAIRAPAAEHAGAAFEQNRVGLHHLCFRARERADVDELHGFLCSLGVTIVRAPREDQWAPGYYSLLFEDPDGIRLELNHVPGKGLLG
jgi:catechol 2,3-dioxygenase-like lactoylglutathione lyase family enzyme